MDNFDWEGDLQKLLSGIYNSENTPFNELAERNFQGAIGSPITAFGNAMDVPLSLVKENIGGTMAATSLIKRGLGYGDAAANHEIERYKQGGGRASWDQAIEGLNESDRLGIAKTPVMLALELGLDPTTYLGAGLAERAVGKIGKAAELGMIGPEQARTMQGANEALNFVWNKAPFEVQKAAGRAVGNIPGVQGAKSLGLAGLNKIVPNALQLDKRSQLNRQVTDLGMAANELFDSQSGLPKSMLPAVVREPNKSLAPFEDYSVPPFFDKDFDPGVPAAIKAQAWEAHQRLKMSQPDLPGINAPGWTPAQQGQQTFLAGQRPSAGGSLLGRLRNKANGPLGFINQPPGGYKNPMEFQADEENFRDMATIGLAAVMDYDNQAANRMFGSLLRSSLGNKAARQKIIEKYGAGAEAYLPYVHGLMQEEATKQGYGSLGSARFITPWGFTQGLDNVDTATLERINAQVASGKMTEDEAREYLAGKGMTKGKKSGEGASVMQEASGMGAAFLAGGRKGEESADAFAQMFHPWEGTMAPNIKDPITGRAIVPEAFKQYIDNNFENNREHYNTYMRQTFGDLTEPELDTLRQMSIENLYDEMVNAAGPVAGGVSGATLLMERGPGGTYAGETYQKIGVLPQNEQSIAARLGEITPTSKVRNKAQRVSTKAMNALEYERSTGRKLDKEELFRVTGIKVAPSKDMTNDHISQALQTVGAGNKEWLENRKGGILPNTMQLIEHWKVGKDIQPGGAGTAENWYSDAVDEVMNIVGPGRYEDAWALLEFLAITSSGTDVTMNGRNALRAFAEWKLGSDDFIRNKLNLSSEEVEKLLQKGGQWSDPNNIFRNQMAKSQKDTMTKAMNHFANVVGDEAFTTPFSPVQGGAKTNNFAGSFVYKLWQGSVDYAFADNPELKDRIKNALDKAATIYTVDRHDSRVSGGATGVANMGSIIQRERGQLAARVEGIRPEDFQAGMWYWSKQQQGFVPERRTDDLAGTLRKAWNDRVDPARVAEIRTTIKSRNPGISEDELSHNADDMMRQEVVIAMLEEELGKTKTLSKVEKLLGRNPIAHLHDAAEDTLGIINRSQAGIEYRSKPSAGVASLVSDAEAELGRIRKGESEGATYAWDGQKWGPAQDKQGFAVALTSAGKSVSTARRKTSAQLVNKFLIQYADLLEDPEIAQHIRFGLFPFDKNNASFDLTVIVPDEATAISLGKQANQDSIFDLSTFNTIKTGGTGTPTITDPAAIKKVIQGVFGAGDINKQTMREVRSRGVTLDEMDSVNPFSILQRRVVKPIMEGFEKASMNHLMQTTKQEAKIPLPDEQGAMLPGQAGMPPSDVPFDFTAIGQNPILSTQANTVLNQAFEGGETYGTRVQKYFDEANQDLSKIHASGATWGSDATLEERLAAVGSDTELQDIIKKYDKAKIDPRFGNSRQIAMGRMRRDLAEKEGIEYDRNTTWDLIKAAWGEQALFSPKYHLGNIQGAWLANAFGGTFRAGTPREFLAAFKLVRGGLDDVSRHETLNQLHSYQIAKKWGFEDIPQYLQRGGVRGMTAERERISRSAMGELAGRVTKNKKLGQTIGKPFAANADMGDAVEIVMRGSLWSDVLDRHMMESMPEVEASIQRMAERQGLDEFEFSLVNGINAPEFGSTSGKIKDRLRQLGFDEGYAERGARNFSEARNVAEKAAKAEVDKRQFTYDRTNLDNFVSNFIPFHYYLSRAVRYYGEEALRHPAVILNYMRANDYIDDAQTDPGLNARQKGFLRLMGTPLGFTLLMNPDALFGVVKIFGMDDSYTPEGEPEAGQVIDWLKQRGMGLYPWLDGTLNLMGVYGDTFEPDLLGIRHKALIGSAVNFMRSTLGMDPASAPYQTAMGQARYGISSFVSQFTPDWLTTPVLPKVAGNTTDASLDTIIESRILANNRQLSNGQLLEIMSDPDSPEYNEAFRQVAASGLAQQLLNFTLPANYRLRESTRDVRSAQISTIYEAAQKQGVSPTEFKPSVGDVAFAQRYENLTGHAWKPGDYKGAKLDNDLTTASPENKVYVLQESEYNALGGDKNQAIWKKYNDLKYANDPQTQGLDEDSARILADVWADRYGHREQVNYVQTLRQGYEDTHPEFAQFKGWQSQMLSLEGKLGGLGEYRRQSSEQNPNAKRYFEEKEVWIRETFPQDQWDTMRDQNTYSMAAFLSINGLNRDRFDSAPQPGVPAVDVTMPNMVQSLMNEYDPSFNWAESLQQHAPQGYGLGTYGTYWNR